MGEEILLMVAREGLYLVLLLSAPMVLAALAIGLVTSVLQAATQLQDASLGFVPRLVVVLLALVAASPWIGAQLVRFTAAVLEGVPYVGR
jgi:flagellar biosynthetic protein FliQ